MVDFDKVSATEKRNAGTRAVWKTAVISTKQHAEPSTLMGQNDGGNNEDTHIIVGEPCIARRMRYADEPSHSKGLRRERNRVVRLHVGAADRQTKCPRPKHGRGSRGRLRLNRSFLFVRRRTSHRKRDWSESMKGMSISVLTCTKREVASMARREIAGSRRPIRRFACGLFAGSLLIPRCASTNHRTDEFENYETSTPEGESELARRKIAQMLAAVSHADRQRCEQFAESEADTIKDTRGEAVLGAIGASLFFGGGAPYAFVLFGIPTIAGHVSAYSKAHTAAYNRALSECLEPMMIESNLGPEHPDLAQSLMNLAERFKTAGKYDEAEQLYRRSVVIQEKALGPDHPDVATTLEIYANILARLDRQSEAEEVVARYSSIRERQRQKPEATETSLVRPSISRRLYHSLHRLTDSFLKEAAQNKCSVLAECVRLYVEGLRELAREEDYALNPSDEATFRLELKIAMDADEGRVSRDEAITKFQTVTTRHLLDMYFARSRAYPD